MRVRWIPRDSISRIFTLSYGFESCRVHRVSAYIPGVDVFGCWWHDSPMAPEGSGNPVVGCSRRPGIAFPCHEQHTLLRPGERRILLDL